jgi:hypothetical protein
MSPIDERLKSLNIVLPDVMTPVVDGYVPAFAPFVRSGDQMYLSGRLGKVGGNLLVNGAPHFTEPHRVADGASELLVQVFGERGIHARSSMSVAQLPFGVCVEIDMIAELEATQLAHSK